MGTHDDSKITVARRARQCAACRGLIAAGERQLTFRPGLYSRLYLHVECALQRPDKWRCKAIEEEAERRAAAMADRGLP